MAKKKKKISAFKVNLIHISVIFFFFVFEYTLTSIMIVIIALPLGVIFSGTYHIFLSNSNTVIADFLHKLGGLDSYFSINSYIIIWLSFSFVVEVISRVIKYLFNIKSTMKKNVKNKQIIWYIIVTFLYLIIFSFILPHIYILYGSYIGLIMFYLISLFFIHAYVTAVELSNIFNQILSLRFTNKKILPKKK